MFKPRSWKDIWEADRSKQEIFSDGPWQDEVDEDEFVYKGIQCYILRSHYGCWLGYIQIPTPEWFVEGNTSVLDIPYRLYPHDPNFIEKERYEPLDKEGYIWVGFDCCRSVDLVPPTRSHVNEEYGQTYRDISFVKNLCKQLVDIHLREQEKHSEALKEAMSPHPHYRCSCVKKHITRSKDGKEFINGDELTEDRLKLYYYAIPQPWHIDMAGARLCLVDLSKKLNELKDRQLD